MSSDVNVLVLTGYGLNCDHETAFAFRKAGAVAKRVHINSLIDGSERLDNYQIMVFVGGFSWGDDHGAGVIQAVRLKTKIGPEIIDFLQAGNLVLGICNGFQTLVNLGLLPAFDRNYNQRRIALTYNDCGNFRNQWVRLKINTNSPCVFTKGVDQLELPVRHGEGKFYAEAATIDRLLRDNLIVMQYAAHNGLPANGKFPFNPNGSVMDIAGICDPTGRVFGLMPHPEAFNHMTNHPDWTYHKEVGRCAQSAQDLSPPVLGTRMFKNAVRYIRTR